VILDSIEMRGNLGEISGGRADDLDLATCTEGDAHDVLVVLLHLGLYEKTGGVDLTHPACGLVISIDGVAGVVKDDDGSFRHLYN
jgi:hypothetical protein